MAVDKILEVAAMTRETRELELAQAIAELAHHGMLDKNGAPIIDHVHRVARACRSLGHEQRLAAFLHDCVEDAPQLVSLGVIETLFGKRVALIVAALTRPHPESLPIPYSRYIDRVAACPDAILIKLADLNDNLDESRGPIPQSLRERYLAAKLKLELAVATGATEGAKV